MKPRHFHLLSETEQAYLLLCQGVEVAKRVYKCFDIHLYQLPGFYVEVFCHHSFSEMGAFRAFEDTHKLDPYLDHIRVEALLQ